MNHDDTNQDDAAFLAALIPLDGGAGPAEPRTEGELDALVNGALDGVLGPAPGDGSPSPGDGAGGAARRAGAPIAIAMLLGLGAFGGFAAWSASHDTPHAAESAPSA